MFETSQVLLIIFHSLQSVYGRKKLQKMIHLMGIAGAPLPFKYVYHHYGPYSASLQEEMNFLVQQGFIEEQKEHDAYTYTLMEKGTKFKDILDEDYELNLDDDLLHKLKEQSSQFLELLSTYAFLLDSLHTPDQAKAKALELKPHLAEYLDECIDFYHEHIKEH